MARRRTSLWTALLSVAAILAPCGAQSQWLPGGTPIGTGPIDPDLPVCAAPDGAGGAFVVWVRDALNGSNTVMLRHVSATGVLTPGPPASSLEILHPSQPTSVFGAVGDGAGGFYLGLRDPSELHVLRFDSSGGPHAGWPISGVRVGYLSCELCVRHVGDPVMLGDAAGGCHVVLESWAMDVRGGPTYYDLDVVRVSASGASPQVVDVSCTDGPSHGGFCADGLGGVAGFITNACTGRRELLTWPAAGSPVWASVDSLRGRPSSVTCDAHGDPWLIGSPYVPQANLRVQRVASDGTPLAGWEDGVEIPYGSGPVTAMPDLAGGSLFLWQEAGPIVRGIRVNGDGSIAPGWGPLGVVATPGPSRPGGFLAVPDGHSGAFVAWLDESGALGPGMRLVATRLREDGSIDPATASGGRDLALRSLQFPDVMMLPTEPGAAMVFWTDAYPATGGIYAQRLPLDQTTPALASLVSADASAERVRVVWRLDSGAGSVTLQRRGERAEWADLARLAPDGLGEVAFEDREAPPGARVGYRLVLADGSFAGEAWVTVPHTALALAGFAPNPSPAAARLAFTLDDGEPATLDVLDVSGRRVFERDLRGFGPGAHEIEFAPGARLAPGLYVIRLTQGRTTLTTRGVVIP